MSNKKEAIVILTPGFPENELDKNCLPERQTFIKALQKASPEKQIIILAFQYPFTRKYYDWYGSEVFSFNGRNKPRLNRLLVWLRVWQKLNQIKRRYKIDGILSFWLGECAFVGNAFCKRNKLPHFIWLLGQDARPGNKYVSMIKPKPGSLIALSDFLADEFFKNYLVRPKHIIPSGLSSANEVSTNQKRTIDILGAGSLIALKRFDLFIEIIHTLIPVFPDLNVVICGGGSEREKLQQQISAYKLEKNICLTGEIPHSELLSLMKKTNIFLHTSSYEGFATVILEALYSGAHVVCFCKPMNEPIDQLYVVDTNEEMIRKLHELLMDTPEHKPVIPFLAEESAGYISELFVEHQLAHSI